MLGIIIILSSLEGSASFVTSNMDSILRFDSSTFNNQTMNADAFFKHGEIQNNPPGDSANPNNPSPNQNPKPEINPNNNEPNNVGAGNKTSVSIDIPKQSPNPNPASQDNPIPINPDSNTAITPANVGAGGKQDKTTKKNKNNYEANKEREIGEGYKGNQEFSYDAADSSVENIYTLEKEQDIDSQNPKSNKTHQLKKTINVTNNMINNSISINPEIYSSQLRQIKKKKLAEQQSAKRNKHYNDKKSFDKSIQEDSQEDSPDAKPNQMFADIDVSDYQYNPSEKDEVGLPSVSSFDEFENLESGDINRNLELGSRSNISKENSDISIQSYNEESKISQENEQGKDHKKEKDINKKTKKDKVEPDETKKDKEILVLKENKLSEKDQIEATQEKLPPSNNKNLLNAINDYNSEVLNLKHLNIITNHKLTEDFKYEKISLQDLDQLTLEQKLKYDKRTCCEYLRDLFVNEGAIWNVLLKKSLLYPASIRTLKLFTPIFFIIAVFTVLFNETNISARQKLDNKIEVIITILFLPLFIYFRLHLQTSSYLHSLPLVLQY